MSAEAEPSPPPEPFRIVGALRDEVREFVAGLGAAPYHADQVLRWVYRAGVTCFDAMTNLARPLRAALAEHALLLTSSVGSVRESQDGTRKLLVSLADGAAVETVVIPDDRRHTACISSQVGCAIGCVFCASGLGGLERDLSPGEIVEQALHAQRQVPPGAKLTNLVVMGIGEPLMNYAALVRALRVLTAPWGLALSPRRITVSTVGIPARIEQLADEALGVNLAVSLHAADDVTRQRLVPHARPTGPLVAAARHYRRATGRAVTFEYVLVKGVNDSAGDARALAELVGGEPILVNLLPLNPVEGLPWEEPSAERVARFAAQLRRERVRVQVRKRRGGDIAGACGQLRRRTAAGAGPATRSQGGR
ncbi:MAG TPA: 23S rRNA (adenine(2503)-C(2))-methyltransferase RlmN [Planctomycetota bacterium]|nr:23S rRNA (adenine(2503)-C(2))-methyltransferase RlmN [Planctomycetota bacterium]